MTTLVEYYLAHHVMSNHQICVIPNFYIGRHECDLFVMNKNLYTTEYEVKTTKKDYLNDFKKGNWANKKHDLIKDGKRTNRFYFVLPVERDMEVPEYAGILTYEKRIIIKVS